jgi:hypothetical protein
MRASAGDENPPVSFERNRLAIARLIQRFQRVGSGDDRIPSVH